MQYVGIKTGRYKSLNVFKCAQGFVQTAVND